MTHLLLFTAFVLWYSYFEANDDAGEIAAHVKIDHVYQWLQRAVVFGSVWYLLWVLTGKPSTWPTLIGHAFLFSAVFRYRLNKRRGMPWWYINGTNVYDSTWIRIANGGVVRPGRIAYLTEITLFALGTAGAIMLL